MVEIISIKRIAGGDAIFNYPSGIRWHHESNVFYIADMYNHRICWLKEDGSTGVLPNVVVDDDSCLSLGRPLAVWVIDQGTLFTADAEHNKIFCKTPHENAWKPIVIDSGFSFDLPGGVAVDESGNVYTNDFMNNRLVQITPEGKATVLLGGEENINKSYGIFYQDNRLYYADTGNTRICYIDFKDGRVHILNPQIETKGLNSPSAITLDEEGNIYICESRSMYFYDAKVNALSLIVDRDIWKEQMQKHQIEDRICHMGAVTVKRKGEIYWVDTIKNCVYQMVLKFI
jgi:sugar lactone lactonase YvrE